MHTEISFPLLGDGSICPTTGFTIGSLHIYWYGCILACAFLLAVVYGLRRRSRFGITEDDLINLLICCVPGAIIGGRLFYVAFNWDLYAENPVTALYVWKGGIAMYGVLLGGVLAAWIYCRCKKIRLLAFLDLAAPCLLLAQGIGRWANFINREAYGIQTDLPWKMGLTNIAGTIYVHPLFLYECIWDLGGFVLLHFLEKKGKRRYDGQGMLLYLVWYGFGRGLLELLREPGETVLMSNGWRVAHPISMACFLLGVLALVLIRKLFVVEPEDLWVNKVAAAAEAAAVEISETEDAAPECEVPEAYIPAVAEGPADPAEEAPDEPAPAETENENPDIE